MDNIELRAPRIRNIIGEVPPYIVRFGNTILIFILVLLFLAGVLIPLPWSSSYSVYVNCEKDMLYLPTNYSIKNDNLKIIELNLDIYQDTPKSSLAIQLEDIDITKDTIISEQVYYKAVFKLSEDVYVSKSENLLKANLEVHYNETPFLRRLKK